MIRCLIRLRSAMCCTGVRSATAIKNYVGRGSSHWCREFELARVISFDPLGLISYPSYPILMLLISKRWVSLRSDGTVLSNCRYGFQMKPRGSAVQSHSAVSTANHCGSTAGSLNDLFQIAGSRTPSTPSCKFKLMSVGKRLDSELIHCRSRLCRSPKDQSN
jgi:hypothetical protein